MWGTSEKAGRRRMKHTVKQKNTDLPYEKFMEMGPEYLTESELLAIILRTGTREMSAHDIAQQVLRLSTSPREGLLGLYDVSLEDLMSIKGIGQVKAVKLKCLTELSMRISRATAREGFQVNNSHTVAQYFMEQLRHRETECVILVSLDAKGSILKETRLSIGSVRMSLVSPREVYLEALSQKAVSIILVHNHPSGDPAPSESDRILTQNLKELGDQLEIPLLDHIIIGDNRYTSFKELSYL